MGVKYRAEHASTSTSSSGENNIRKITPFAVHDIENPPFQTPDGSDSGVIAGAHAHNGDDDGIILSSAVAIQDISDVEDAAYSVSDCSDDEDSEDSDNEPDIYSLPSESSDDLHSL